MVIAVVPSVSVYVVVPDVVLDVISLPFASCRDVAPVRGLIIAPFAATREIVGSKLFMVTVIV
jgi:hypothetical protein